MDIIATDDKPKPLPAFSGPPPPTMHPIPPHPDRPHPPPATTPVMYEQPWRPHPPPFDHHPAADQRRTSSAPQPPLPPHAYPVMGNRELPQLPPDGPYGRQGSMPGPAPPAPPAPEPHAAAAAAAYPPINGTSPHEPSPHSAPPDYRSRMPFAPPDAPSNGDPPSAVPPPTQYSTPIPPQVSHTPAPYDSGYYNNPAFGIRQQRKAARAQQACDQCRARKAKCDEGRPACSHCKENNLICVYKEVPPHKQEKATQLLLDRMQQLEDRLEEKMSQLQSIQIENGMQLSQLNPATFLRDQNLIIPKEPPKQTLQHILKEDPAEAFQDSKLAKDETGQIVLEQNANDILNSNQAFVTGEDGELSIPVEHTTAAHKLLLWPSIKKVLEPKEYDEDYVMKLEEDRGLIRVYGRGEGDNTSEDPVVSTPSTNPSAAVEEMYMHHHHPSPTGPWGGINQPQSKLPDIGLDDAGRVTTTPNAIRRYHKSYMEHLHKLHPFLDQNDLERKIELFITTYCPGAGGEIPRGAKRKRSCEALHGAGCDVGSPATVKAEPGSIIIEKSIDNAIVLLVLALGCICEVRDRPVPGPLMDHLVDFRKEQIPGPSTRSLLSPAGSDSVVASQTSSFHSKPPSFNSPWMGDSRKTRPYPDDRNLRNLDVIPGLAFYAYATSILGNLQGANGLHHVQAALLAGLYAGQLAHPFQSHGWIAQAARACQVLVRSKRYEKMRDGPVKDLYDFAYWTCLQLESDILAELDLPASGISRSEARIALPKGRFTLTLPNEISAPSTMMMFFYSAQIHLRKVLNRVHTDLYKVEKQGQTRWSSNVQEILSMNLELWRSSLPEIMKWKDSDPPSKDINVARMRAKYYGARYIIHRPLLYHALHYAGQSNVRASSIDSPSAPAAPASGSKSQHVSPSMTHSQSATAMSRLASDTGPARNPPPPSNPTGSLCTYRELPAKLRRACKVCVDSAIMSTEAFDGIEGRPVVTNIFGTAHAQFGNMLVLSATYMSSLSELVDRNDLERLLKRTINFLLQSRYISPSLRADARILTEIYEKIFGEPAGSFTTHYD
ncbi:hypothetical protein BDV59DRAFT_204975 [Aspergillus ambiguus]|uniref:putative C6 finger domain protein n=1 Tax=Aspergillus ambiguus TaxID=176160 RepID=UPI003CCD5AE3